jgi:Tol biopolymer transport system component
MTSRAAPWAIALAGIVACQSAPTAPEAVSPTDGALYVPPPQVQHRIGFYAWSPPTGYQLYTVKQDGSALTQVTSMTMPRPYGAVWSPVANRFAFILGWDQGDIETRHVAVIGTDGSGLLDLTPLGVDFADGLAWSPDGGKIAFTSHDKLMVMDADGTGLDTLAVNSGVSAPAWSPDGQRLVYFAGTDLPRTVTNDRGIWSVNPDGTGRTKIRNVPAGSDWYHGLQFSPDGQRIAMCHTSVNGKTVELMNADGTGLVSLLLGCIADPTGDGFEPAGPQWSPNGNRILTVHDHDLWSIAADGSSVTELTTGGTALYPYYQGRWSRQGTRIAYVHNGALWLMATDGSSKTKLTPAGLTVRGPSWGP